MAEAGTPLEVLEGALLDAHRAAGAAFAEALGTDEATQEAVRTALDERAGQLGVEGLLDTTTHLSRAAFALSNVETNGHGTAHTITALEVEADTQPFLDENLLDGLFGRVVISDEKPEEAEEEPEPTPPEAPKSPREQRNYFDHSIAPGNMRGFITRIMPNNYINVIREMRHNVLGLQLITDMILERYEAGLGDTKKAHELGKRRIATVKRFCGLHEMDMEPSDIALKQQRAIPGVLSDIDAVIRFAAESIPRHELEDIFEAGSNKRFIPVPKAE